VGLVISFQFTVAMDLFILVSSIWAAGGVIPIVGALLFKGKKTPAGGLLSMVGGSASYMLLYYFPISGLDDQLPICFLLSFVLYVAGNRIGKPIYKAKLKISA
jgi:SSS family solute:Na+ symporter